MKFETWQQQIVDSFVPATDPSRYSVVGKTLKPGSGFSGILDTSQRNQGIVYAKLSKGNSMMLTIHRFPQLENAKNGAIISFSIDTNHAVCDLAIEDESQAANDTQVYQEPELLALAQESN